MLAQSGSAIVGGSPAATVLWLVWAFALSAPSGEAAGDAGSTCLSKPLLQPFKRHGKEPAAADLTYCTGCVARPRPFFVCGHLPRWGLPAMASVWLPCVPIGLGHAFFLQVSSENVLR